MLEVGWWVVGVIKVYLKNISKQSEVKAKVVHRWGEEGV